MNEDKFEKELQQDLDRMNASAQQPQQPAQPVQPVQQVAPQKENTKPALIMCIISLICNIGLPIGGGTLSYFAQLSEADLFDSLISVWSVISSGAYIASIVLMIIVRVKYRKYTFGKVLMWVYIVEAILSVLAIIVLIVLFYQLMQSCKGL